MAISSDEATIIDNDNPTNEKVQLGTEVRANQTELTAQQSIDAATPRMIRFAVTADASAGLAITIPYAMTILDVIVECTATNGAGTLTLQVAANAITDAIVCAVDTTMVRAGTLDATYTALTTSTALKVHANGAADRGIVTILGVPA